MLFSQNVVFFAEDHSEKGMKFERKYYGRFEHRSDCLVATQSDIERSLDTSEEHT